MRKTKNNVEKLIRLAERLQINDGPAAVLIKRKRMGRTESFVFLYKTFFGIRFLCIKDRYGLPIAIIKCRKNGEQNEKDRV